MTASRVCSPGACPARAERSLLLSAQASVCDRNYWRCNGRTVGAIYPGAVRVYIVAPCLWSCVCVIFACLSPLHSLPVYFLQRMSTAAGDTWFQQPAVHRKAVNASPAAAAADIPVQGVRAWFWVGLVVCRARAVVRCFRFLHPAPLRCTLWRLQFPFLVCIVLQRRW
jgi:hypothetical protein